MKRSGFSPPTPEQVERRRQREAEKRAKPTFPRVERSRKPIRKRNPERLAKRREVEFGPQAEECRHLPCCVCHPDLYTDELRALDHRTNHRISDPHHIVKRPGGTDGDTIPLCMGPTGHHRACSGINSSERVVESSAGRGDGYFRHVADLLAKELEGNQ